jgi:hypothetical protein
MDKKIAIGISIIAIAILLAILMVGSKDNNAIENNKPNNIEISAASKIELFMFHATQRCSTCIKIGQLAKATVEERFPEQLRSGKIEFREINIDLPENRDLAEKFQAGGSSLFINAIRDGQDDIEEDVMVWQLTGNSINFKNYLSNKINIMLGI